MIQAVKRLLVCRAELIPAAEKLVFQSGHRWAGRDWVPPCGAKGQPQGWWQYQRPSASGLEASQLGRADGNCFGTGYLFICHSVSERI